MKNVYNSDKNRIKNVTKITKILVSRFDKSIPSQKMNKDSTAFIYANTTGFSLSKNYISTNNNKNKDVSIF